MNYQLHYNKLMDRSPKNRPKDVYLERHRIVPGCMGGKYVHENIAYLTPEEHYVAHQLLVKMYPDNRKLIYAANMMGNRTNKKYGWLKRLTAATLSIDMKGKPSKIKGKSSKLKGTKQTAEIIAKRTMSLMGKPKTAEHVRKVQESKAKNRQPIHWINNITTEKMVPITDGVPPGFTKGRIWRNSEEYKTTLKLNWSGVDNPQFGSNRVGLLNPNYKHGQYST